MYPDPHDDLRAHRDWLLSFVDLPVGGTAVDLACGDGSDLLALAARHRDPAARFLGIDASESAVATAAERAAADPRVTVRYHRLAGGRVPLADGSVDAVYSHNLLECLDDREAFAREVGRILRPGGVAVIAHWDFDSQAIDGSDRAAVRRLVHAFADWQQPWMEHADGWMGRRLWGVFAPTGLFEGTVHGRVLTNTTYAAPWYGHARVQDFASLVKRGLASEDDHRRVVADLEALHRAGRYFYSITGYAYVGRRSPRPSDETARRAGAFSRRCRTPRATHGVPSLPPLHMASRDTRKRWKAIAFSGGAGVVLAIAAAQFTSPHDRNLPLICLAGLVLGAVLAPGVEPKLFPAPAAWQAALGAAGGGLLALGAGAAAGMVFTGVMTGAILGVLARYWIRYF